jgi:hypothetical protein
MVRDDGSHVNNNRPSTVPAGGTREPIYAYVFGSINTPMAMRVRISKVPTCAGDEVLFALFRLQMFNAGLSRRTSMLDQTTRPLSYVLWIMLCPVT